MDCFKNQGFENDGFENQWFLKEGFGVFVQRYKYMHIYLWTALRIRDLRMMDLRINGF
jgi:hypothetical protein